MPVAAMGGGGLGGNLGVGGAGQVGAGEGREEEDDEQSMEDGVLRTCISLERW